ncbi:MAG: insulinase family protein [Nannocystis sp.]|nr:pitrilysin family protein [Nannocystis sp.]MBA3547027.1 insulinase family protein [Nannocystis sp.]
MRTQLFSLLSATALLACRPAPATTEPVKQVESPPPLLETSSASSVWPDEPFRAKAPAATAIAELKIPDVTSFKLDNGLQVHLVRQDKLPTVQMTFAFDFGSIGDPKSQTGLTSICMDLLDEGTKKYETAAFEEKQADHAVNVSSFGGLESAGINVRALKSQLGPALDLMAEMLQAPGMRQTDLDRLKDRRKASLLQAKASPGSIGGRLYSMLVWGDGHPYGRIETEASINAVGLKDCQKVIGKLKPDGAHLWVTGMVDEAELRQELGARLPKWSGKAPARAKIAAAKPRLGTVFFVDVKDAAQSSIYVGHPGPRRQDADYEATDLMLEILGGSFASRINMNLREDKGYTYGGRAGVSYRRAGGSFSASSSVRTDVTGPALREVIKEIVGMRGGDPTVEELRRVQEGAMLALPADFATPSDTLSAVQRLSFFDLPFDWYKGYQQRLRAVDTQAVRAAAEKHLRAQDFVVLVVGDASKVLKDLDAIAAEKLFGAGGLVVLDADGKPAKRPAAN